MTRDETRPCERCGRRMIQRFTGNVFGTYPAYYEWEWWCGCGHRQKGGEARMQTEEELLQEEWERVNGEVQ